MLDFRRGVKLHRVSNARTQSGGKKGKMLQFAMKLKCSSGRHCLKRRVCVRLNRKQNREREASSFVQRMEGALI